MSDALDELRGRFSHAPRIVPREVLVNTEIERVKVLCAKIKGNKELRKKLRQSPAHLRESVYELLVPFLTFKAAPYEELNKKGRVR
jgi:hypothetical protein